MPTRDHSALAEEAYNLALEYELNYGCCPQCVLASIQEIVGIIDDQLIKASHALSGGGGLMGRGACGALAGGLLALSAKRGRDRDKLSKGKYINNFKLARTLVEKFRLEFGGVTCEELQQKFTGRQFDLWDSVEYQAFDKARGNQCAHATATVTKWVVELL